MTTIDQPRTLPLCGDDGCTAPVCQPQEPAAPTEAETEADPTAAKRHAFRPYTRLMSDTTRRQRAEKYPNPVDVPIKDFLAACREESRNRSWCGTAQSMVRLIKVGDAGRSLVARHPQWNPELNDGEGDYDTWAVNPLVTEAGITTFPSAQLVAGVQTVIDKGYNDNGYRLGMDNILSKVWCTFVPPPQPTWRVKLEVDITAQTARDNGYNLVPGSTDADYVIKNVVQRMLRYDQVEPAWELVTPPA